MRYINFVLLGCMVIYSSLTLGIDLSIKKGGNSIRIDDGSVSIDTPDTEVRVGKRHSDTASDEDDDNDDGNISEDTLAAIVNQSDDDIEHDNVQQRDLKVTVNSSGDIRISGHVENLVATINGSGDLNLEDLIAERASVKVNASGTANVNVRRELKAEITGSGDINYRGNPKLVKPKISGSGSIEKE